MKHNYKLSFIIGIFITALTTSISAQEIITVKGTVSSVDGDPLIGANVTIQSTSEGTVTDLDGGYEIEVPSDGSLVFSFIGFRNKTEEVQGRTTIDVILEDSSEELGEIVVTALGMSRDKKKLGYAVDNVGIEELESSGQTNVVTALQGRVPGVMATSTSGAVGSGMNFTIRGITSINPNRSNRPLIVIDGVEVSDEPLVTSTVPAGIDYGLSTGNNTQTSVSNRLIDINPNDVASMSVLKGAAATALYGVRASNGAVIITTKKGKSGAPEINLHYGMGWSMVNKYPDIQTSFIDGNRDNSAKRGYYWDSWGSEVVPGKTISEPRNVYKDFYVTGNSYDMGASVSAGNETFSYRLSTNHHNETGIVPASYYKKTNFSLNAKYKVNDRMEISADALYANSNANTPSEGRKSVMNTLAYMAVTADVRNYDEPYSFGDNAFAGIIDHPMYLAKEIKNISDVDRLIGSVKLKYRVIDGLDLNYVLGLDHFTNGRTRTVPPETDEGQSGVNGPPYGFLVNSNIHSNIITSNLSLNFNRRLSNDLTLGATVGQYLYTKEMDVLNLVGKEFEVKDFFNFNSVNELEQNNSLIRYRNPAVYAEASLGYRDYLYLTLTGRNDWSSTLPKANRSYFFPSASLSWLLSESFVMPEAISFMKLRASYAVTGKDAEPYEVGHYYSPTVGFPFGDRIGYYSGTFIGDENLKPEFSNSAEVGVEASFFHNRLGIDFSYYQGTLTDMILPVPVSNASGIASYTTNAGSMTNYGLEGMIYGDIIKPNTQDGFRWTASINWSMNRAFIDKIDTGGDENEIVLAELRNVQYKYVEGGRVGDMYGMPFRRTEDGQLILDEEGLPNIDLDTFVYMGNAMPDFVASLNNSFSYKGVTLSFLLEWKKGGKSIDIMSPYGMDNGQFEATLGRYQRVVFDGVQQSGTDSQGNPVYVENTQATEITPAGFYRNANRHRYAPESYLQPSDWLRLRNISVSYDLPVKNWNWKGISAVRLSLIGNNLFLDTPYVGWDPESNFFGANSNIYGFMGFRTPNTKSYQFKINVTL